MIQITSTPKQTNKYPFLARGEVDKNLWLVLNPQQKVCLESHNSDVVGGIYAILTTNNLIPTDEIVTLRNL